MSAIAAEHEVLLHVHGLQGLRDLRMRRVPAVADEHAAAEFVDVADAVGREHDPLLGSDQALVAALAAVDFLHAVVREHHDDFTNHGIQAGTQAAAVDDASARLCRVEVEVLAGARGDHLKVHLGIAGALVDLLQCLCAPRPAGDEGRGTQRVPHRSRSEHIAEANDIEPPHFVSWMQHAVDARRLGQEVEDVRAVVPCARRSLEALGREVGLCGRVDEVDEAPSLDIDVLALLLRDRVNRQVHIARAQLADRDAGEPGHRAVHRVLREHGAIDAVVRVRGNGSDHVRGVDEFDRERHLQLLEMLRDLVLQVHAHIRELFVAAGVGLARA
mmetsp:Transcript_105221/g.304396  ORF Transcript_105221/g.304396 Transcript_105221/m.304396 type:complete len:330 (-) Transcript_105221:193-1182(-)